MKGALDMHGIAAGMALALQLSGGLCSLASEQHTWDSYEDLLLACVQLTGDDLDLPTLRPKIHELGKRISTEWGFQLIR